MNARQLETLAHRLGPCGMTHTTTLNAEGAARDRALASYFLLACGITWLSALPAALAWIAHEPPTAWAVACAGLSAFGPLLAVLAVASPAQRKAAFRVQRARFGWLLLALFAPAALHVLAIALYTAFGGHVAAWLHFSSAPEQLAALVVFPIGEEFGWRGFAYPRLAQRFGPLQGSLILGLIWGLWHLAYAITPLRAGFDPVEFASSLLILTPASVILTWIVQRGGGSLGLALAFHAGAHLDHLERSPDDSFNLRLCYVAVLCLFALWVAPSLAKSRRPSASR